MNRIVTRTILLLAVAGVGNACDDCSKLQLPRTNTGIISDVEALQISGLALSNVITDAQNYQPLRWYQETNFFARNVSNSNDGYVFWLLRGDRQRGYTV